MPSLLTVHCHRQSSQKYATKQNFGKEKKHVMWGRTYTRRRRARDIRRAAERAELAARGQSNASAPASG